MALRKIGAIASGETPSQNIIQDGSDQLNTLVKSLNATGLHIWTETEAILFLQPGQFQYTIGAGTTDHIADLTGAFNSTTLANAGAVNGTTISVLSTTGFVSGYVVGVVLDNGTIFWSTEVGSPSGLIVTMNSALPSTAAAGNAVYVYQTDAIRPLRVVNARRFNFVSNIDTIMIPYSRIDYRNQPNKNSQGTITQWFYDPRGGANTQAQMFVWPAPANVGDALKFTWWRPVQDFTSAANIPDLPNEWLDALVWNLAWKWGPEFDVTPNRYNMIKEHAASSLDNVEGWDREPESYLFGADLMMT
jgi:hypothetical protein